MKRLEGRHCGKSMLTKHNAPGRKEGRWYSGSRDSEPGAGAQSHTWKCFSALGGGRPLSGRGEC